MGLASYLRSAFGFAEAPSSPDATEYGSNAVSYSGGREAVSRLIDSEYRYELRGRQGNRTYRRMRWSDPHIWGLREAQNLPMLQARAAVEPADPDDPDAVAKAELVQSALVDDYPWRSFLRDSLLDFDYGFACFEIVWQKVGGEVRCRLALRPASSIDPADIYVRDGAIDHVIQRPEQGGEFRLPGEKLVWFAHCKEGDVFFGRPILRPMYKPWKIKEELEIELPIAIRKLGGVPDITTRGDPTAGEAAALDAAAQRFGLSPDAFMRHTDKVEVKLLTGNVQVDDILAAIAQRNTELTAVCQAQVFDLGTSHSGSRALGSTLSDLFSNSLTAHARRREDVLNAPGGLIHQLVAYNFPRDDNLPALRFGSVQRVDLQVFARALLAFSQADLPPELDEWARREMNMPEGATTQVVVPEPQSSAPPEIEPGDAHDDGARASESASGELLLAAPLRKPRGLERYVALAEVDALFDDGKQAVRRATQVTRDKLVAELLRRAFEAAEAGRLERFIAGSPPMVDALAAEIEAVMRRFYEAGRRQVEQELERQRRGEPIAAEGRPTPQVIEQRTLADPVAKLSAAALARLHLKAALMARAIALSTQTAAALAAARIVSGMKFDAAALTEEVTRASDAAALRLGLTVYDAIASGRHITAGEHSWEVKEAVYSSILDRNRCSVCAEWEGRTTSDLSEAEGWTPNASCEGTAALCRCLVLFELEPDAAEVPQ